MLVTKTIRVIGQGPLGRVLRKSGESATNTSLIQALHTHLLVNGGVTRG
jgi:hypothetical protein